MREIDGSVSAYIVEVETILPVVFHAAVPHADDEVRIGDRDGEHIRIVGCWFQLRRTYTVGVILSYAVKVGNSPQSYGSLDRQVPYVVFNVRVEAVDVFLHVVVGGAEFPHQILEFGLAH